MPRSIHGGRHELGQNHLHHRPTIEKITDLIAKTDGPILEIGAGDGALTRPLARLERPLTAIDIDEHRIAALRRSLSGVTARHADALVHPLEAAVIVGNLPFHITTPLLRRLLAGSTWSTAVLLTQWEVARKRAGVGGSTMMTAQTAPWFDFRLVCRVPAAHFRPRPSVDGGLLRIERRAAPLVDPADRAAYEHFVRNTFTGRGRGLDRIIEQAARVPRSQAQSALSAAGLDRRALPRDLSPEHWAAVWHRLRHRR